MGPGKPSSLVTTLSNCTFLLWGGLVEGEWDSLGWWLDQTIARSQDFIPGAEAKFWLSRDFSEYCRTWDPRGHAYDVLVRFFPCRVYTNSNRCDTLRYEWPHACCFHFIVCLDVLMVWFRGWLLLSWGLLYYFNYDIDYFVDVLLYLHVIVYSYKPNTWLN
jgi:hypothetical protein